MQPITIAPVTRTILECLIDCYEEGWFDDPEDLDDVALLVANTMSPRANPDNPLEWTITLPSADGTQPDS